jgi:hypothetical protein
MRVTLTVSGPPEGLKEIRLKKKPHYPHPGALHQPMVNKWFSTAA